MRTLLGRFMWPLAAAVVLASTGTLAQQFTVKPLAPDTTVSSGALKLPNGERLVSVIVKFDADALASYRGGIPGLEATSPITTGEARLDVTTPRAQAYLRFMESRRRRFEAAAGGLRARITHDLPIVIGGVSVRIPESEVGALASLPGVAGVYEDELLRPDTDNSPTFIGAAAVWNRLGGQGKAGEGVIVGVIDTGIWPEHPSFADNSYPVPPAPPSGIPRACRFSGGANPGPSFTCNNKLIGAYRFMATYSALNALLPAEYTSARDEDGHGTHTSSTAAGNANVAASIFGIPRGTVSGIAPRAHVIMYKVCGAVGCYGSDSAAAVQQAIQDGVNVINFSIGGGANPYSDAVSLAFLDAYNAGIFVAASAGNSGPGADTTDHREPWVTTVGASTEDRAFANTAVVTADGGASLTLNGASLTNGVGPAPVYVPTANPFCAGAFAANSVTGQIVVCERGDGPGRAEKGYNVLQGGAVGMILYNQSAAVTDEETDNHYVPAIHVQNADGLALLSFISSHTNVRATLTAGVTTSAQGDVMASFSSRGGPGQTLGVSKPDITAPGVQILAGHSPLHLPPPAGVALGPEGELFQAIAGTSMSSPHVAGAAALLKALNPSWTPGQIKSALMTTARTNVVKEDGVTRADPFDFGSGRLNLSLFSRPGTPGITFSAQGADFITYQNNLSLANLPSLFVPGMVGRVSVTRTVRSELKFPEIWLVSVDAPSDVTVLVPFLLFVPGRGQAALPITVDARSVQVGQVRHARLKMVTIDGLYSATFPISIVRGNGATTVSKTCDSTAVSVGATANCEIAMTNTSFNDATVKMTDLVPLQLRVDSVNGPPGTTQFLGRLLGFTGTLAAAAPPDVFIGSGPSPGGGYLPLSLFGIAPIAGVGDDTVTNFNVPSFVYAGQTYTRLGVGSNGTVIVGGSSSSADTTPLNQSFPNPTAPNNVLAPFWTDLNPAVGGAVRIATLTDGVHTWIVVDWAAVKEFSTAKVDSFEAWIGINGVQDISFAYGPIGGNGDGGLLTVGAENLFGNRGANYYSNGAGALPVSGTQLVVTATPGAPGETKTVNFTVRGIRPGSWTNCAEMTSNLIFGTAISCWSGVVNR